MSYDSIAHYSHCKRIDPVAILMLAWKFLANNSSPTTAVASTNNDVILTRVKLGTRQHIVHAKSKAPSFFLKVLDQ